MNEYLELLINYLELLIDLKKEYKNDNHMSTWLNTQIALPITKINELIK